MNDLLMDLEDETEGLVDQMFQQADDTVMPIPSIESEPHVLISKIRKHYLEYIIKLLTVNYERKNRLEGKNLYLPSAIWRCAKNIEMNAARSCMVAQLYRKNILLVIKSMKIQTKGGKLYKPLLTDLQSPPNNEKKIQTKPNIPRQNSCICECTCGGRDLKKKLSSKKINIGNILLKSDSVKNTKINSAKPVISNIPVIINQKPCPPDNPYLKRDILTEDIFNNNQITVNTAENYLSQSKQVVKKPDKPKDSVGNNVNITHTVTQTNVNVIPNNINSIDKRLSIESQDKEDDVMLQLERLFHDSNEHDDDDCFELLLNNMESTNNDTINNKEQTNQACANNEEQVKEAPNLVVEEQAAKIRSLDERLALLESSGLTTTIKQTNEERIKRKKSINTKWPCEEYFKKVRLYEKMDQIREQNRKKHERIKKKFLVMFGEDSDDDQVVSPLEETSRIILSCQERIAAWIVHILTPYYKNGRIVGKMVFKRLAKHLLTLIYRANKYPSRDDVEYFVEDFIKRHPIIKCDGDYTRVQFE